MTASNEASNHIDPIGDGPTRNRCGACKREVADNAYGDRSHPYACDCDGCYELCFGHETVGCVGAALRAQLDEDEVADRENGR